MTGFAKEAAELRKAKAAMAAKVNAAFPVGTPVIARWGRGWMYGVVACAAKDWTHPEYIGIRSQLGRVHSKHYSEVELEPKGE